MKHVAHCMLSFIELHLPLKIRHSNWENFLTHSLPKYGLFHSGTMFHSLHHLFIKESNMLKVHYKIETLVLALFLPVEECT